MSQLVILANGLWQRQVATSETGRYTFLTHGGRVRLEQLIKPLEDQTDSELLERLQQIRHNREVAQPVRQRKVATAEKKEATKRQSGMQKMLEGLSPEDRAALMKQLEEGQ